MRERSSWRVARRCACCRLRLACRREHPSEPSPPLLPKKRLGGGGLGGGGGGGGSVWPAPAVADCEMTCRCCGGCGTRAAELLLLSSAPPPPAAALLLLLPLAQPPPLLLLVPAYALLLPSAMLLAALSLMACAWVAMLLPVAGAMRGAGKNPAGGSVPEAAEGDCTSDSSVLSGGVAACGGNGCCGRGTLVVGPCGCETLRGLIEGFTELGGLCVLAARRG